MLAIYFPPAPDEVLYSYLCRLAYANGIFGRDYFKALFRPRSGGPIQGELPNDCHRFFSRFWKLSGLEGHGQTLFAFFLSATTYPFESAFFSRGQQTNYIFTTFQEDGYAHQTFDLIQRLRFCPRCRQEDLQDYGTCYYHRSHQLSNVTTCWKHGCPLWVCPRSKRYRPLTLETEADPSPFLIDGPTDQAYAEFCHDLLEEPLLADREGIIREIRESLKGISRMDFEHCLCEKGIWPVLKHPSRDLSILFGANRTSFNRDDLILLAFVCLADKDILSAVRKRVLKKGLDEEMIQQVLEEQGSVILDQRQGLFLLRHNACGTRYVITGDGILNGFPCPVCTKGDAFFRSIIEASGKGEYELVQGASSMQDRIRIKHISCGRVYDIRCIDFITRGQRCPCRKKLTLDEARMIIGEVDGFTLVRFRGIRKEADILHDVCGGTFSVRFDHFRESPSCRCCHPTRYSSLDIRKRLQALAGDEYELVGGYQPASNPILRLRHNKCGTVRDYSSFFHGQRCPVCRNTVFEEDLKAMVLERSGGRYSVTACRGWKVEVSDAHTGEKKVISRLILKQELMRPTPSPMFPGFDPDREITVDWDHARRDEMILESFSDYLFFEDLTEIFPGYDEKYYIALARELRKRYGLKAVATKVYARPGVEADAMEIIRLKYMERNGRVFGYHTRGHRYADKSGSRLFRVYIRSNAVTKKTEHKILGVSVRLNPPKVPIDADNFRYLRILDYLTWYSEDMLRIDHKDILDDDVSYRNLSPYLPYYPEPVRKKAMRMFKE